MSSEREALRLRDIIDNIDRISVYLGGMVAEDFGHDRKTVDAVERCLQRITEAVVKIGEPRMLKISPSLPMRSVRGLGNILRHEYDMVDHQVIWNTITDRLPTLRSDCERALEGQA